MLTSSRRGIIYPNTNRSDSADVPRDTAALVAALEIDLIYGQGTLAARPTSTPGSPGIQGRLYVATDSTPHVAYYDYGTGWDALNSIGAGSITRTMLATDVPVIPVGGMITFPWISGSIPAWTALPVGQALLKASFPDLDTLANASGYPYGSDATHVNLPDFRSRTPVGLDDMGGVAAVRVTVAISGTAGTTLGGVVGSEGVALTSGQIPAHTHTVPDHQHSITNINDIPNMGCAAAAGNQPNNTGGVSSNLGGAALTTSSAGSGGSHTSMQPGLFVNFIMRVT